MLSVTTATNCRTGPAKAYDLVGGLLPGETAEIIGRDPTGQYWYIRDSDSPTGYCWLWGNYATPVGNYGSVPVLTPMPTPTPAPSFTVAFATTIVCGGSWGFNYQIENNGGVTWESIRITMTDNTTATGTTHQRDSFRGYNNCNLLGDPNSLASGASAIVSAVDDGEIAYNPAGHDITAIIRICSGEGLGGVCVRQTIDFTP
jgi:hypothetical protein